MAKFFKLANINYWENQLSLHTFQRELKVRLFRKI